MWNRLLTILFAIMLCFGEENFSQIKDFDPNSNSLSPEIISDELESGQFYKTNDAINGNQLIEDFRVNEQEGNSSKNYVKSAINDNNISIIVWSDRREGTDNIYA